MRFLHYINELVLPVGAKAGTMTTVPRAETKPEVSFNVDEIYATIKRDCKPFLNAISPLFLPVYRGTPKVFLGLKKFTARTDRWPKDTKAEMHTLLDEEFKKKFGWKARSEGVFGAGDNGFAGAYGEPYYFFPIGQFKFVWSESINDLYASSTSVMKRYRLANYPDEPHTVQASLKHIHEPKFLMLLRSEILSTYKDKNLKEAIRSFNEIMFKCKEYYLVNIDNVDFREFHK